MGATIAPPARGNVTVLKRIVNLIRHSILTSAAREADVASRPAFSLRFPARPTCSPRGPPPLRALRLCAGHPPPNARVRPAKRRFWNSEDGEKGLSDRSPACPCAWMSDPWDTGETAGARAPGKTQVSPAAGLEASKPAGSPAFLVAVNRMRDMGAISTRPRAAARKSQGRTFGRLRCNNHSPGCFHNNFQAIMVFLIVIVMK